MEIKGVITAMVTPFDANQQINPVATRQLIDALIGKGVDGLFILGTNGEFFAMNDEEKVSFAKLVIDYVNHRVPVYVGAGSCGTQETIQLAKRYRDLGADAISVITPYFLPITQQELIRHYTAIAEEVDMPVIMYNMPKNTGTNIDPSTVAALLHVKNIVGIKDSSGNLENLKGYIDAAKNSPFAILVGSDSKILAGLQLGAHGTVAATSNAIASTIISIYQSFMAGDLATAEAAQKDVDIIRGVLPFGTVPSVIKRAVTLSGIDVGPARYPVLPLNQELDHDIQKALDSYQK